MSKSRNLVKSKLFQTISLIVLVLVFLIVSTFGQLGWRLSTSDRFLNMAVAKPLNQDTPIWYELSAFLSPTPEQVRLAQSRYYLANSQPDAAISVLSTYKTERVWLHIGKIQFDYARFSDARATLEKIYTDTNGKNLLLSKVYLEVGDAVGAITAAKRLTNLDTADANQAYKQQLGLSYLVAGDSANAAALIASMSPSQGLDALRKASIDKYSLAAVLARSGLLNASELVLDSVQVKATDEWQLWGTVRMARKTSPLDLKTTADSLDKAVKADPSNLRLRKLLREVYAKAGDETGVVTQTDLINRLETGTP